MDLYDVISGCTSGSLAVSTKDMIRLLTHVAEGLDYVHSRQMVHGDV